MTGIEEHVRTAHARLLPECFAPAPGVTWSMVHHLLHRLEKWHPEVNDVEPTEAEGDARRD